MTPQDDPIARLEAKVDRCLLCLQGNLGDGTPGVVGRVDRLEQKEIQRDRWTVAAIGGTVAAIGGSLWAVLKGQQP